MKHYFVEFNDNGERQRAYVVGVHADTEDELQVKYPNAEKITAEDYELYVRGYIRGPEGTPVLPPPPPPRIVPAKRMDEDIAIIYESLIEMREMLNQQTPTGGNP